MRPPKHRTRFLCFCRSSDPNLTRRRKSEMPNRKIIAICNQKGGVEKTTTAVNLGILDLGKQLMPIGMLVVLDSTLNRITQNRAKGKNTFIFVMKSTFCSSTSIALTSCSPFGSVCDSTVLMPRASRRTWTTCFSPTRQELCWQTPSALLCSITHTRTNWSLRSC